MEQKEIIELYKVNEKQVIELDNYVQILEEYNKHTNLVGKSTLINPWTSHILDSLQLLTYIKNRRLSVLDMGTGAGIPGVILSIMGCSDITLVDSNGKKIRFLNFLKNNMNLNIKIWQRRVEEINNAKFDIITSRALKNLNQLISYSQKFLKKNSVVIFLKGKTVNDEIYEAKKNWSFQTNKYQSLSDPRGYVLELKNIKKA